MTLEFLDHTADIGVRIRARNAREFFAEALRGFNLILLGEEGIRRVRAQDRRAIELKCVDAETLLVDFFNELIYLFDSRYLIFNSLSIEEVDLEGEVAILRGELLGEVFDPDRHTMETEVKAATFHDLKIERDKDGLTVDMIFDL